MNVAKGNLRREILKKRSEVAESEIEALSRIIMKKAAELYLSDAIKLIMCYMDFRNEVKTGDFIKECLALGKRIALPRVEKGPDGRKKIFPYEIKDLLRDVTPGTYGILEPNPELAKPVKPSDIDLVIVPGVVFDERKFRIGYGGGYYDRFLSEVRPDCIKLAPAFELQIVDEIPREGHDIPVDVIITDKRLIL